MKTWFFEKINKNDKSVTKWTKSHRKRTSKINQIRDEKGDITIGTEEIHIIIRTNFKNLYSKKNGKPKVNE